MISEPPAWAGDRRVLLHGGSVYSAADPFATAMLIHGSEIAWVGSEGAALAMADGVDDVIALDGALVTPAFVDADVRPEPLVPPGERAALAAGAGVAALQVIGSTDDDGAGTEAAPGPVVARWSTADGSPRRAWSAADATAQELAVTLADGGIAGPGNAVVVPDAGALQVALAAVQQAASRDRAGRYRGLRLHGVPGCGPDDIEIIAGLGLTVVVAPDPNLGFAGVPLAALAAAGVPLALGSGVSPLDPWRTLRAAVHHADPDQRISSRAAFAAHTRGGWRAAGAPGIGTLVPGAPAHYVIWDSGDLIVEAPDDRIQAWSTDPRSGTPGLPDLREHATLPICVRTVVWGRTIGDGGSIG